MPRVTGTTLTSTGARWRGASTKGRATAKIAAAANTPRVPKRSSERRRRQRATALLRKSGPFPLARVASGAAAAGPAVARLAKLVSNGAGTSILKGTGGAGAMAGSGLVAIAAPGKASCADRPSRSLAAGSGAAPSPSVGAAAARPVAARGTKMLAQDAGGGVSPTTSVGCMNTASGAGGPGSSSALARSSDSTGGGSAVAPSGSGSRKPSSRRRSANSRSWPTSSTRPVASLTQGITFASGSPSSANATWYSKS